LKAKCEFSIKLHYICGAKIDLCTIFAMFFI
jgi:hypothetical protein